MFRIERELKQALNKSHNVIFLYGENIYDAFYYDFYFGTLSLKNSLYHFFYREYKCDIALHVDFNMNLNCLNKKTIQALDDFYNKENYPQTDDNNDILDIESIKSTSAKREALKKAKKTLLGQTFERLSQLDKFLMTYPGRKFVLIEAFEWLAELFNFHIHNYDMLRVIYKWMNYSVKDTYILILLKDVQMLNHYYFNTEAENFINIPFAKVDEYFNSFYRHFFLNYKAKISINKLNNLATAFKTNNYNLKNSATLFAKELKNYLNNNPNLNNFYESFNKYFLNPIEEKIDFDNDLILDKNIKERLKREFTNFLNNEPSAKKGIILTGPPGTGKTLIAKSIANLGGFNFMPLKLSDLKQLYVGHSGAEVKKIFEKARSLEPTVIFIDEIDAVFPKRDNLATDSFAKDITNEFIAQVDGVDTGKQRIFIIGATNIPEVLDSAVISRFDMQQIPLPKKDEREKLFELYIPQLKENNWIRLNKHTLLEKTEGLSGRDIKEISNTIKNKLNNSKNKAITKDLFDLALENFKEKVISTNRDKFEYLSFKNNKYNFSSIIGYYQVKKEFKNTILSVLREAELKLYNIEPERGILLYGPPGNGKSFIAKAIAGEFNLDFIKVLSKDISSYLYSEDSKKLADIFTASFKIARLSKNGCVLFFDEFDGIASKNVNLNLRATLLDFIVQSREVPNLILIAATNYKDLLDEATIREGRFDKKIRIDNPSREDIFDLTRNFLKEFDKVTGKPKVENLISSNIYDKILNYFEGLTDQTKRSIAGVKVFCNNLKRYSFFNSNFDSSSKTLIIDDNIVLDYLNSN
ncbi:MAG: hypothetical protein KatS3mg068_2241 [Candidatus Sericytochromatia bacterium]|nr:MAG: hypothetical protein KatS3mg068_2241 [Candidatus Sericytochromatia bacterium]